MSGYMPVLPGETDRIFIFMAIKEDENYDNFELNNKY